MDVPKRIYTGGWRTGHVQGIAVDPVRQYIYFSFTTVLLKTDFGGKVIGYVANLTGHLGCIDFNDEDGKIYGSLEFKHDAIGKGIVSYTGRKIPDEDAFYIACFDADKIDRENMDAEKDGIMKTIYLPDVTEDYSAYESNGSKHRYGCSGIDGLGIGPVFGESGGKTMLMVAYGIYNEVNRTDNDHQVLLQLDWRKLDRMAAPLSQIKLHHSGMRADKKYFIYTGNTDFGIQNLEYDKFTGDWFVAVYKGEKPEFCNYNMFVLDGRKPAREGELIGRNGEKGLLLELKNPGKDKLSGMYFPYGQTGIYSFGDGRFYIAHGGEGCDLDGTFSCDAHLYRFDPDRFQFNAELNKD